MTKEPLSIYLAARFARKEEIKHYAERLAAQDIRVVSDWYDENLPATSHVDTETPEYSQACGERDIKRIIECNTLVRFSDGPGVLNKGGGRFTEFGYALAQGKRLYLVGKPEIVFDYLPQITHFSSFNDLFHYLVGFEHSRVDNRRTTPTDFTLSAVTNEYRYAAQEA